MQVVAHARQRDVHDGYVEHHHELRNAGNSEDHPLGCVTLGRRDFSGAFSEDIFRV